MRRLVFGFIKRWNALLLFRTVGIVIFWVTALEIQGSFDDCQALVKSAFLDRELSERLNLTSANSINLARLVPQSFYYIHAARQLPEGVKPTFVIPSGNFGNLTAGLLAMQLGLPVDHFVAATNRNDVVPEYLRLGQYSPRPSVPTISNAMDVGRAVQLRPHAGALRRFVGIHENAYRRHDLQ